MQAFDKFAAILQRLGNARLPYLIYVDAALAKTYDRYNVGLLLSANTKVISTVNMPDSEVDIVTTDDKLLDIILDCNNMICVVFADLLTKPYMLLPFTELHLPDATAFTANDYIMTEQYRNVKVYIRKLVDNPDFVALQSKGVQAFIDNALASNLHCQTEKLEPWHTILVSKSTRHFVQIIWDTRQITGYGQFTEHDMQAILQLSNANDNSLMLYNVHNLPIHNIFLNYIAL